MERAKNPHHCVSIVKQMHPDASGATFETDKDLGDTVPGLCYANFGIIGLTEKSRFQTCKFGRKFCYCFEIFELVKESYFFCTE